MSREVAFSARLNFLVVLIIKNKRNSKRLFTTATGTTVLYYSVIYFCHKYIFKVTSLKYIYNLFKA